MMDRGAAVRLRMHGRAAPPDQVQEIADALDAAAKTIEKI
jgi:hypothetical protein